MEAFIIEVLQLMLRYFHAIAAIAWIGASFYFIWLDNHLETPPAWKQAKGIKGDLWAIHGGGFYEVAKYSNGPETMPKHLHWFKWEAYTTWITGFLLLTLVYYVGADAYLIDADKAPMAKMVAIAGSVVSLLLGWLVYDLVCKSRLNQQGWLFAVVMIGLLTLYSYILSEFFTNRAAYLHVGALIGTCMAANVFFHIIPAQRYLVAEVEAGRVPDPAPGANAKSRSVHNNYATLPVIFIMLSNHFALLYMQAYPWLIVAGIVTIGLWIRHYFNLKHRGIKKPQVLISGILAFCLLMATLAPWAKALEAEAKPVANRINNEKAISIMAKHCEVCHSKTPTSPLFASAPMGLMLDNLAEIKAARDKVYQRTIIAKDMPLANMTKMTDKEREQLGQWLESLK